MGKQFKGLGEQELRNRQWSQQDFHDFFKEEGGLMNSSRFRAVEKAFKACEQLQKKPITEENAMKMVKANQELMKACKEYAAGKTSGGERRLAVFEKLVAFQEAKNLDQIRDLRLVRDYEKQGKHFEDVASFEVPHVTLEGKREAVGANVSQRIKMEVNGKKGFFTEENQLRKASDYYLDLVKEAGDPELKALYGKNYAAFEKLCSLDIPKETKGDLRLGEYQNAYAKEKITSMMDALDQEAKGLDQTNPSGKKRLEEIGREKRNLEELRGNDRAVRGLTKAVLAAKSADLAADVGVLTLDQTELTSRNIAMSRMAELLGVGGVIAYSQKMVVKTGDKEMTGCFMEFAEGRDINSADYNSLREFGQVEFTPTASFNQDMINIEILDYFCNQADRHGGNMFYKLSEPDEHGKRNVIGLQGIDNDLAFGNSDRVMAKQDDLKGMVFIGRETADRIRKMDASAIDYALGDLIPETQRNLVKERLTKFQEHMKKNMVEIDKDGWELKSYSAKMSKEEFEALDPKGKAYVNGVRALDAAAKSNIAFNGLHKSTHTNAALEFAQKGLRKQVQEMEQLGEGVQALYGEDHEKGVRAPEKEPAREPISLKEIQERNKAAQSANIRPKLAFEKEVKEKKEPKKEAAKPQPKKPAARKKEAARPQPKEAAGPQTREAARPQQKEAARPQPPLPPRKPGFQAAQPKQAGGSQRVQTNFLALGGGGKTGGRTSMRQTPAQPQPQRQKEAGGLVK